MSDAWWLALSLQTATCRAPVHTEGNAHQHVGKGSVECWTTMSSQSRKESKPMPGRGRGCHSSYAACGLAAGGGAGGPGSALPGIHPGQAGAGAARAQRGYAAALLIPGRAARGHRAVRSCAARPLVVALLAGIRAQRAVSASSRMPGGASGLISRKACACWKEACCCTDARRAASGSQ